MVEVEAVETPENLAWVRRQADQRLRAREALERDVEAAEQALDAARRELAAFDEVHEGEDK